MSSMDMIVSDSVKIVDRMVAESLLMLRHDINLLKRLVCELKDMSENERISIECMKDMDLIFKMMIFKLN